MKSSMTALVRSLVVAVPTMAGDLKDDLLAMGKDRVHGLEQS